jgi:hypothetical protein
VKVHYNDHRVAWSSTLFYINPTQFVHPPFPTRIPGEGAIPGTVLLGGGHSVGKGANIFECDIYWKTPFDGK